MKRLSAGLLAAVAVALAAPGAAAAAPRHPAMSTARPSQLVITPSQGGAFDFGAVQPGQSVQQQFRVTDARWGWQGTGSWHLTGSSAFSIVWNGCAPHHRWWWRSCFVVVSYAPAAAGASDTATLSVSAATPWWHGRDGRSGADPTSITLTGSSPADSGSGGTGDTGGTGGGDPAGQPGVDVSDATFTGVNGFGNQFSFSFGQVEQTVTHSFTVTNNSTTATLVLDPLAQTQSPMVVDNDTCGGQALTPGGTCTFDVTFDTTGCPGLGFDDGVSVTSGAVTYAQVEVSGAC